MNPSDRSRLPWIALTLLFSALSVLLMTGACLASRRETEAIRAQRYSELHAIATLKIDQIVTWRNERLGDARTGAAHLADRDAFTRWLAHPGDAHDRASLLDDLAMFRDAYGYRTLAVLGVDGRVLLSLAPQPGNADPGVMTLMGQSLKAGEPVVGDIFREPASGDLYLDITAPILGPQRQPLAVLLLRTDPEAQLFPMLQSWPMPSETAETTLVRREGDQVLWLNRPRHSEAPPLTFSLPVSRRDLSAVQVVLGRTGEFYGIDYRGAEVMADLEAIPGSPWFMTAKVDTREIMEEAHYRSRVTQGFAALGILLSAMLLGFIFYLGEAKLYRGLFKATRFVAGAESGPVEGASIPRLRNHARTLGLVGALLGLGVLAGWVFDLPALKGALPGFAITKVNTAFGILLLGAGLAFLASPRALPAVARSCAAVVFLLGTLTLAEHLSGMDFRIDQALLQAPGGMYGALAPGRMAPVTALEFTLAGVALFLASFRRTLAVSQWIAIPVGFIPLSSLLGQLLGSFGEYGLGKYLLMTFPASGAFLASSLGLLLLHANVGFMRRGAAQSMGGWLLRHVTPFLIGAPLLAAWIWAIVLRQAWLEPALAEALVVVSFVAFLLVAAWWAAYSLDNLDAIRNQAELDLRESREMLGLVLNTVPQSIFWKDREGRFIGCNRAFATQMGFEDPAAIVGKTDFDLPMPRPDVEAYQADDQEVMLSGRPKLHIIEPLQAADGGRIWVETSKVPLRNAQGNPAGVLGIYQDITGRIEMERALKASEAWYHAILRTAMDGFLVVDGEGRILEVNEAYACLVGHSMEELVRMRIPDLEAAEHPEETTAHLQALLDRGQHRFETRHRHRDGRLVDLDVSVQLVPGDDVKLVAFLHDITERKRREELIRANQERLTEAQALAHLGSWEMDLRTRSVSWSQELWRLLGLDPGQCVPSVALFQSVIHPEDREAAAGAFDRAIADRTSFQMVHRLLLADGTVRIVEARGQAVCAADGVPVHAMGTLLDITGLKNAEASLLESEARLRVLSDHLPGGLVYQMDSGKDGSIRRFTYISAGVEQLHGVTPLQAMDDAMAIYGQVHEEDRAILAGKEAAAIEAMVPFSGEYRVRHPSGGVRWLLACSSPRRLASGHLIWDGVELDITERKLAEGRILAQTELLNLTGRMAQVGGMEFDPNTLEGTWTEEMARIHDLEYRPEIDAQAALAHYPEESRTRITQAVREASESGKPFDLELELVSAKGHRKLVHLLGNRAEHEGRKVILSIVQDITQKKAAESELRRLLEVADRSRRSLLSLLEDQRASETEILRLNADLERRVELRTLELAAANKELEAFAYSVSHDLRAPLRHMDGFMGMLARHLGDRLDAKGAHFLEVAQRAAVRMGQLVDGLLSFSRLGRAELRKVEVDTGQLAASVIDEFKAECAERTIDWRLGRLPLLNGDPTLLRLVFQNLVGNALKFTRNRPETVIEIEPLEGLPDETGFSIRDNGVGFDPAYAHKLFGVFQRLHREDEFEGTGIGLANVHRIVARHDGRIWAEGRLGEGAAFFLAFPKKGASR